MKILVSITVIVFLFPSTFAYALARATFSDPSKLQPPAHNVYPNVSGNVQSNLTSLANPAAGQTESATQGAPSDANVNAPALPQSAQTTKQGGNIWWLVGVFLLAVLSIFVIVRRRMRE